MNSAATQLRRAASLTATLWLGLIHAGFLWRRLADESLTEPRVLARWLSAALMLGAFVLVRRMRWRRAPSAIAVFWLLVALLHVAVPAGDRILDPGADVSLVLQSGLTALPAGLVLAAALAALQARDRRSSFALEARTPFAWSPAPAFLDATRAPPLR